MATLTLDLAAFKAAGVYTLEVDNSQTETVQTNSLRLAVGFNETGPFNRPVFLNSKKDKDKVFGTPNTKLEHRGCYFNRSLETLLEQGPVFALNLINVNQNPSVDLDKTEYACFSLASDASNPIVNNDNSAFPFVGSALYSDMYDKTRFWIPSSSNLLSVSGQGVTGSTQENNFNTNILSIGNCGTKTFSVIVRKAENLSGYDVTAKTWYDGEKNIPFSWIHPNDYISDYFIQVIAIDGDWSDFDSLAADPYWESFFTSEGLKKDKINAFLGKTGVSTIGSWTGCIIPDFYDKQGNPQYIQDKVNKNSQTTGIILSINESLLEATSYSDANGYTVDMDENGTIDGPAAYHVDLTGNGINSSITGNINFLSYSVTAKDIIDASTVDVSVVNGNYSTVACINAAMYDKVSIGSFIRTAADATLPLVRVIKKSYYAYDASQLQVIQWTYDASTSKWNGAIVDAASIDDNAVYTENGTKYIFINGKKYSTASLANTSLSGSVTGSFYPKSNWKKDLETGKTYTEDSSARFTNKYAKMYCYTVVAEGYYVYTCAGNVSMAAADSSKSFAIEVHKAITDASVSSVLRPIPLKGLSISARHMPGYDASGAYDPEAGVNKIYDMLLDNGIYRGLTNPEMIDFRYIVDTMGYGLTPESKHQLGYLAMKRESCLAIISAPAAKTFADSTNPYFCDTFVSGKTAKPQFDTKYIPLGGNQDMMASFSFSLASETNGAKFSAYFFPYLTYTVSGKTFLFPPAADVANAYIQKFTSLKSQYAIVANLDGILSGTKISGIETMLDNSDRESLEPFGINPIITRNGNIMIFGDKTAYQTVKSDFNYIHVREHLNTIAIKCNAILSNYVFRYNNAATRADIVSKLTPILQSMQDSGVVDTYTIVMDESNNTADIINESYGVIDIGVTFTHGLEKIITVIKVNKVTD